MKKTKGIKYKILPTTFEGRGPHKGWDFVQIKREEDIAMYVRQDVETQIIYYEVIIVQRHDGRTMPGNIRVSPSEFMPSDNMFGLYGWCYNETMQDKAESKFKELVQNQAA